VLFHTRTGCRLHLLPTDVTAIQEDAGNTSYTGRGPRRKADVSSARVLLIDDALSVDIIQVVHMNTAFGTNPPQCYSDHLEFRETSNRTWVAAVEGRRLNDRAGRNKKR
jgi:hypothetical protein